MKYITLFFLYILILNGCSTKKKVTTVTEINQIIADKNVVLTNSDCYNEFYNSIDTFLNIRRPSISDYENRHLVPCCMELINSGDTLAKSILLQRIATRIEIYKSGNEQYISIYKIVQETLGNLPDEKALELSLILFEIGKIRETKNACGHLGYYIFKNVLIPIIEENKANEYNTLHMKYYREAVNKNMDECESESYVYNLIKPLILLDYLEGRLKIKQVTKL